MRPYDGFFDAYVDHVYDVDYFGAALDDGLLLDSYGDPFVWPLVGYAIPFRPGDGTYDNRMLYDATEVPTGDGVAPGTYYLRMEGMVVQIGD